MENLSWLVVMTRIQTNDKNETTFDFLHLENLFQLTKNTSAKLNGSALYISFGSILILALASFN